MLAESPIGRAPALLVNPRLPITQQVYELIRRAILTLELKPSEGLSEKDLAARLGVSRTPVREALIKLSDEGLIDILPQRGSFVAPIRLSEVMEAQLIREALEAALVRCMAEAPTPEFLTFAGSVLSRQKAAVEAKDRDLFLELDEAFHKSISDGAGLKRSWRVIQSVKIQMDRVRYLSLPVPGQLALLLKQHQKIFEAIKAKNPDRAERVMRLHLKEVFKSIKYLAQEKPSLFV